MQAKQNCWEYMECGREPNGFDVEFHGVCSALTCTEADGLNDGKKGGRICWAIAGTFFDGEVTGKYACEKFSCANCDFFKLVNAEQGVHDFVMMTPAQMTLYNMKKSEVLQQSIEKRSSERSPSNYNACFSYCNINYSGTVTNISDTGMFITIKDMSFPHNAQITLQININNKHLTIPIRIRRLFISRDPYDGMGVEVIDPPLNYRVCLNKHRTAELQ